MLDSEFIGTIGPEEERHFIIPGRKASQRDVKEFTILARDPHALEGIKEQRH